jgi:hypothetical protein
MFILGRAHQSHPAKHVLGSAVGGGWPLSQAQPWVANKSSAQPGSPCAGRQTPEGGRPWPGLTRPGPVRLARPAAATLTNTPQEDGEEDEIQDMNTNQWIVEVNTQQVSSTKSDTITSNQQHT